MQSDPVNNFAFVNNMCRFFTCLCRGTTQTFCLYRNLWVYSEIYGVCNVNYHAIFGGSPSGNKSFLISCRSKVSNFKNISECIHLNLNQT